VTWQRSVADRRRAATRSPIAPLKGLGSRRWSTDEEVLGNFDRLHRPHRCSMHVGAFRIIVAFPEDSIVAIVRWRRTAGAFRR